MILIADSGSTKTNWVAIDYKGNKIFSTKTKGLNPAVFKKNVLTKRIFNNDLLNQNSTKINNIYFYGAGCGTKKPKNNLKKVLKTIFKNSKIIVYQDTLAAVYSVTTKPAIVCILGTGSNCSYFDGKIVHQKITSLGYAVMDDASGNYFGRILLRDFFYHKMPKEFKINFELKHNLNADIIKENLYKNENPNTYLASFSHFLVKNKNCDYAQKIIYKGLKLFIENQILQYEKSKTEPIHFIGSLAFYLKDEIQNIFKKYNLNLGRFERRPIIGLVKYHKNLNN